MKFVRAALLAFTAVVGGFTLATIDVQYAEARCKYGSGKCGGKMGSPAFEPDEMVYLPDDGWTDPDCQHYGNCH